MLKYHNFWRPVNFADKLEKSQVIFRRAKSLYMKKAEPLVDPAFPDSPFPLFIHNQNLVRFSLVNHLTFCPNKRVFITNA